MDAASLADTASPRGGRDFANGVIEVQVNSAAELDEALNEAVALVLEAAEEQKTGIMVTRMAAGRYIVQTHPEVPFRLVRQRHV